MSTRAPSHPWTTVEPYKVSVDQYRRYRQDGYLVVPGLVLHEHVAELQTHTKDIMHGRFEHEGVPKLADCADRAEFERRLLRIHMLHRTVPLWERYLLYPRILDVCEALIGPDVMAMQTMMFVKYPGSDGQGFHQDSYYIPVFPDTLIGAWIAIDRADEENGCLWMSPGSNVEPIYPPTNGYGYGDWGLGDIATVSGVGGHSNDDEDPANELRPIAQRYRELEVPARANPGDVVFFGGHVLHRSLRNRSADRTRRCLVNHYANARSFTSWDGGNHQHILARGNTQLPFAKPRFGTPCAALDPKESLSDRGAVPTMMMAGPDGTMEAAEPAAEPHDH